MSERELEKKYSCGEGKEIDEYLGDTICESEDELEDVAVPGDAEYDVRHLEDLEEDDRYKEYLKD